MRPWWLLTHVPLLTQLVTSYPTRVQLQFKVRFRFSLQTLQSKSLTISDIIVPVCDQPLDDVPVLVSSEIQVIFTDMPIPDFVVTPELVAPFYIQQDKYYEVFPLSAISHNTNGLCYGLSLVMNVPKQTELHHNLIVGGFGIQLCGSSFLTLLFISLHKTQG